MHTSRVALQLVAGLSIAMSAARAQSGLPPRDEWQRAPAILAAMQIDAGQRVADVAAGTGYLTRFLATKV